MNAETTLFELSETVFGILAWSLSIKVVVEPTTLEGQSILPEYT